MKSIILFLIAGSCFVQAGHLTPPTPFLYFGTPAPPSPGGATDSPVLGVFAGRSTCRGIAKELNITAHPDCFKLKWELTLYRDPGTLTPTTYQLRGTLYRERIREGKWTIVRGAKINPEAVVYQLDPDHPQGSLLFLRADDNILFFLDHDRNLMVGDGDFSYTLNRTDKVQKSEGAGDPPD